MRRHGRRPRPIRRRRDAGERVAGEILERRYRRLIALYPSDYRAAYADEMLAVALALSSPGQRRPGLGEAVSLRRGVLAWAPSDRRSC